jgi:hypothetical protein
MHKVPVPLCIRLAHNVFSSNGAKIATFSESTKLFAVFLPILGGVVISGEDDEGCGRQ